MPKAIKNKEYNSDKLSMKKLYTRDQAWKVLAHNKLYEDVVQIAMVSTPFTILSAFKYASIASWGKPYYQLTKEEKTRACFTYSSERYASSTQ